ncbi:dihydropteroate synthase [Nocardioides sp. HDW12B]|uniref:dihydropteroate synthase n=1 Tax=Nocardioides sp. HDW12B TaxID=2714939 RepID=UPI00140B4C40|nr:dihydropteroate synthase [Nocardioides sp. HDW12B]QIK68293.1 dihydropteroate synthase [Nocardioides sp. HDW12B]
MGILNVTPDSFSDGGLYADPAAGIARGLALHQSGADLVDVGGESTRPGARRPSQDEELARVVPVVRALAEQGVVVSVDTMRAEVARRSVEAGAAVVNDVSGGLADPAMLATVADLGVPYVLMHWRAHSVTMQQHTTYGDVVADVTDELSQRLEAASAVGLEADRIILDPGIGFSKDTDQNWQLLAGLDALRSLGRPVLVGVSRKRFLGELLAADGVLRPPRERDDASHAAAVLAAEAGAWCVRTHEVAAVADAVAVVARWQTARAASTPATPGATPGATSTPATPGGGAR